MGRPQLKLLGCTFGKLTVIGQASNGPKGHTRWYVLCECGNSLVLPSTLTKYRSCGCSKITHGLFIGARHTNAERAYYCWTQMIQRCTNPKCTSYKNYGARGIAVCARWRRSFVDFLSDMGPRPPGTSLDRSPNQDGNYEPGNVRWATRTEQARNRSDNKLTRPLAETIIKRLANKEPQWAIAKQFGLSVAHVSKIWRGTLWSDLERPWRVAGQAVPHYIGTPGRRAETKKRQPSNRITAVVAQQIVNRVARGETQRAVAKTLRLRPRHVNAIWIGTIWPQVKRPRTPKRRAA